MARVGDPTRLLFARGSRRPAGTGGAPFGQSGAPSSSWLARSHLCFRRRRACLRFGDETQLCDDVVLAADVQADDLGRAIANQCSLERWAGAAGWCVGDVTRKQEDERRWHAAPSYQGEVP